ncbi:PAS-domain containing protein [Sphingomonas sp. 37zxx]|uniref:PAS-domain containing protein n=1 Tax=Sphingomonas sp. 37zxx TaxID=1550073 RepID=UPI00053BDE04|nr:PAS-domain containing protein [Sphingomonas sp. 37zxx]
MNPLVLTLVVAGFAALLFAVAAWVERRRAALAQHRFRHVAYALSLAVYCTSWTFFGAVGSAAADGWSYLPIYLGPMLVFAFAPRFLRRLVAAVQAEGATTISDFIGSRFGKSRGVAALVTITAALGVMPYIALQLRSVGVAFSALGGGSVAVAMGGTAIVLAMFAMLFGTRRYEASGRNEGVVFATAFESLVKLAALAAVAGVAVALLLAAPRYVVAEGAAAIVRNFRPQGIGVEVAVITLLSMTAILCLPRQFYMSVIEAHSPADIVRARWPFVAYLAAMTVMVLPITWAGLALLPAGASPDLFVLQLPLAIDSQALALVAFLGGFSAATAMVVVETIALSTMVSNDLIAPILLRSPRLSGEANLGRLLLNVRRLSIVLVIAAALLWARSISGEQRLAVIGHIAFAATAQIAPLLLLAVDGRMRDALAAKVGLTAGLVLWLWTLALPPVLPSEWLTALSATIFDPRHLLGIGNAGPLVHGVAWSLGANLLLLALVAARKAPAPPRLFARGRVGQVEDMAALSAFVARFVGEGRAAETLGPPQARPIAREDARRAERLVAGVVGAPSARALMASALAGERLGYEDVARMLDESGQSLQFSKGLLAATLEHIDPGVSVVDGEQRLVAWNSRYLDLFGYPEGMVHVGAPVADLIRWNAIRGDCGPGEVDAHVERRLGHLKRGEVHSFERIRPDGRVLKTVGGPMPGGGYVMCFTDTTTEARARAELEARVTERTAELTRLNEQLALATRDKTRFLAAASHDLLQPLHAARLFSAALGRETGAHRLVERVDKSIAAAEQLLRALLDISKLDAGGIEPAPQAIDVRPLLHDVVEGFRPLAAEKGLRIRLGAGAGVVDADPVLLRSILQNFVSNAIRYTDSGGVLVGARRRGGGIAIEVIDTGHGIPDDKRAAIFREFERLGTGGEGGIGLGLAIVERTARLIGAEVTLRSQVGRGSAFGIVLPVSRAQPAETKPRLPATIGERRYSILVVDDDPDIVDAMRALLEADGHRVTSACDAASAVAALGDATLVLVDFHLGDGPDGLATIASLRRARAGLRAALVTADASPVTLAKAHVAGVAVLAKPLAAATLSGWIAEGEGAWAAE